MRVLSPIKPVRSTFKSKSYSELYKADLESRSISISLGETYDYDLN